MCEEDYAFEELLSRARGDYLEMPGLHLSAAQAARLWAIQPVVCEAVLACLTASGFLRVTEAGRYARSVSDGIVRPRFRREAEMAGPGLRLVKTAGDGERDHQE